MTTAETTRHSRRALMFRILEQNAEDNPVGRLLSRFIVALIIANGIAVVLETNEDIYAHYLEYLILFEVLSVQIFTLEYFLRFWAAAEHPGFQDMPAWRARITYLFSPLALVDLMAIAPFYLSLIIPIDLRYLRLFRLLRLLKLTHYFDGLHVFVAVLRREAGAIAGALLTMMILIILSACLMFTVENAAQPGHFSSIAQAIWWAVVTLTTVGYGDITPITFAGKFLAIIIMLLGVGTMALPAGIMAARFTEELQTRRETMQGKIIDALNDGVLDADEAEAIERLQKELGLSTEDVRRIVSRQTSHMRHQKFCPNCGESLAK